MDEIIKELSKKLPSEAVQRTKGIQTKKGYDTVGYGYQYVVDRFNDVLGTDWNYGYKILHEEKGKYRDKTVNDKVITGSSYFAITVDVAIAIQDKKPRSCVGSHTASNYGDALKGAITNGFKKGAAFWGVGRDAFAATIDDDANLPEADSEREENKELPKQPSKINGNDINTFEKNYNNLSDNIKDGFKVAEWSDGKIKVKCLKYNFDEEKLKEEINKDLK